MGVFIGGIEVKTDTAANRNVTAQCGLRIIAGLEQFGDLAEWSKALPC